MTHRKSSLIALAFGAATALLPAWQAQALEVPMPVPLARPQLDGKGNVAVEPTLANGLAAIDRGDLPQAREIRDRLNGTPLEARLLTWAMAMSGSERMAAEELAGAARSLAGWPGLDRIRANLERALYRGNPAAATVISAFALAPPETADGEIALARALRDTGRSDEARALVGRIWREEPRLDAAFAAEFAAWLEKDDHLVRMKRLLYRDQIRAALMPAQMAGAKSLYQAWVQTIRQPARADTAIARIDEALRDDPAVTYLKVRRLRHLDKNTDAARLLISMPDSDEALIDPEEWWIEQRIVSRGLFEKGDAETAYRVAAAHRAGVPRVAAEAEFHAGWYALSGLAEAKKARPHFERLLEIATTHGTEARALYWLGRTAAAEGAAEAKAFYEKAATFPATYYGQLAAATLGRQKLALDAPVVTEADRANFGKREVVQAMRLLQDSGSDWRAAILYRALAGQLESAGEIALLAGQALEKGDHRLALQIGKIAWNRGLDVAALAFPLGALPETADTTGPGLALAYSVARQESAFDVAAVSPADARGLLQLLPGTARGVAARHGLAYSASRLTTDAAYNATLGAHYLREQIERFGGSYILTFIAYNAGPARVDQWIARFGDPRGKPLEEVVDWVEKIPFPETRNYVQHVLENYQVYKARLGEPADIAADLRFGRNR